MDVIVKIGAAFYGPFNDPQQARDWGDLNGGNKGWTIYPVFSPRVLTDADRNAAPAIQAGIPKVNR